jgi:carboxypeptidase PM20D1
MQIARSLSAAVQIPTVSFDENTEKAPFLEMHRLLEKLYPLVHSRLQKEVINQFSLLFTWKGAQPDLAAVAFLAHMDVVPAAANDWTHKPFSGDIADGYIWGRGVIDMKCQLISLLEAVEALLAAGYQPRRTIFIALGHDEEIGGRNGARMIAQTLKERGVALKALLDEGGGVAGGVAPGIKGLIANIAFAEKSFANIKLEAAARAGHASMPGRSGAIGILSRAILRLEGHPMPTRLEFVRPTIQALAPQLPFPFRLVFGNLWLFGWLVQLALAMEPVTNAMLRNTIAPTILAGGFKSNVLPGKASVVLNCRLLPGVEVEELLGHIRKIVNDKRVTITCDSTNAPSRRPVTIDTPYYADIAANIGKIFPGVPVCPILMVGASDAQHYQAICELVYRFQPITFQTQAEDRTHGVDERITLAQLPIMVDFNARMLQAWGSRA